MPVNEDFATCWTNAESMVRGTIARRIHDAALADDVLQHVARQAWQAFETFQHRSSCRTWLIAIANREVTRALNQQKQPQSLEKIDLASPEPEVLPEPVPASVADVQTIIAAAVQQGMVTPEQALVLQARLATPDATWAEIGITLGLTATNGAVLHLRGIQRLRVYIFATYPHLLGSPERVQEAMMMARRLPVNPLTDLEAAAFQQVVVERVVPPTARAVVRHLDEACQKIAKCLDLDWP